MLERKQLTSTYGDISRFFNRCSTATGTLSRSVTLQPEVIRKETASPPLPTWIGPSDTPSLPPYALTPRPGWQGATMQLPQSVPIPVAGSQSSTKAADELVLKAQNDFRNEKSLLETVIVEAGHEAIFYPKFHCELNYIEYYWAALKRFTRENCK